MPFEKDWREDAKRAAVEQALKRIRDGQIVGLGSGSTAAYAIRELGKRIATEGLNVLGIPTSYQSMFLAIESGIKLTTLNENPEIDIAIDGADQVSRDLNLIKGGGAALTREKIIDSAAKDLLIVVDETKIAAILDHPVPLEIFPIALQTTSKRIQQLGGKPILRQSLGKVGPVITDNNNFIIDVDFGVIKEPGNLENKLKTIPGIVETGLFLDMATEVYVGNKTTVHVLRKSII